MSDIGDIAAAISERSDVASRMAVFYRDLDAAIETRSPVCTNRGLCCDFDAFDHDLFVTPLELAHFIAGQREDWTEPTDARRCPYQIAGKCTARHHRPMGCRVFFCDETARDWQQTEYEKRLAELKRIGAELGIEYRYGEWLSALKSVPPRAVRAGRTSVDEDCNEQIVDPRSLPVIQS